MCKLFLSRQRGVMNQQTNSLDEAIRRSKLSSSNQMEMLTFRLTDNQLYGINVFKIIEILECPKRIDKIPQTHPAIGLADMGMDRPQPVMPGVAAAHLDPAFARRKIHVSKECVYSSGKIQQIIHAGALNVNRLPAI